MDTLHLRHQQPHHYASTWHWMYPNKQFYAAPGNLSSHCVAPMFGEASTASTFSSEQPVRPKTHTRSPTWSSPEEEILIRLYKENAEPMRKKGKKEQVLWQEICHKLNQKCQALNIVSDRTWLCKEKFFNLEKK